jgi:hypothetical protein
MRRISDTRHRLLSARYRLFIAARCAIVVESTVTLTAARHVAIVQIPIDRPRR